MIKNYGIQNLKSLKSNLEIHLEEFQIQGYSVINDVLSLSETKILRDELDRVYELQEIELSKSTLKKINEEYLARIPLYYSEHYLDLAAKLELRPFLERILGMNYVLHLQNGVINMPNQEHHQSSWHRDLPYQNWTSSAPLACNLFYCLDDFSEETGSTLLLPYSHLFSDIPSINFLEKHKVQINAKAGSVVLFNSMVFHKAGFNSSSQIRRGVNNMYIRPILKQQIDLPELLKGKYSEDPYLSMLLGYDSKTSSSIIEFRQRRLKKLNQ